MPDGSGFLARTQEAAMDVASIKHSLSDAARDFANARGRSAQHIAIGVAITAGAVLASTLIARRSMPAHPELAYDDSDDEALARPGLKAPRAAFSMIWPPLFLALTLSGLRIWNAPRSPARTQALTLWGVAQALNATWMALGPGRLGGQLATAVMSLGTSAAYAWRARQVDAPAAGMVAPYVGWMGFANVLTEELWRRNTAPKPTIH
jgi:tryptophan-rich sensory protein